MSNRIYGKRFHLFRRRHESWLHWQLRTAFNGWFGEILLALFIAVALAVIFVPAIN